MTNRIWLRMGVCTSLAIVATIIVMTMTMLALDSVEYAGFYDKLPLSIRQELDYLEEHDLLESARAQQIYTQYWTGNALGTANISLAVGLLVCLPFGLLAGFWISRYVAAPMASIAVAAKRISHADFSARAITTQSGALGAVALVWADRCRMQQVIGNLIENVLRYAAHGKRLDIAISTEVEQVRLTVRDRGDGLPSCMQHHLFERFYRPDASRARATGGSGLGLAIVKSLMTAQDGDVSVESSRVTGCTVILCLPRSNPRSTRR